MVRMTVSLPEDIKDYLEAQVGGDFADTGEFLTELVRRDREARLTELRRIVDDALAGGVSTRTVEERIVEGDRIARERGLLNG